MSSKLLKPESMNDETTILALIDDISKAHYNKDVAAITAPYAQGAIVCDLAPPLAHQGMDRQSKQAWLDTWEGPIEREARDFTITVSGDLAFAYGYYRLGGTPRQRAARSVSGCAQQCVFIEVMATGGSSTSTPLYLFTWTAA